MHKEHTVCSCAIFPGPRELTTGDVMEAEVSSPVAGMKEVEGSPDFKMPQCQGDGI